MVLLSAKDIKILLKKHDAFPKKWLGQNFLIDSGVLRKIIDAAGLTQNDIVLEIGPGLGVLTMELAKNSKKVVGVEKDEKLAEILKNILKERNVANVEIVKEDILKIEKLKIKNFKVVANLPYYVTAPVIRKFLESDCPPKEMVLMVQKEVSQRICAKIPKMNLLAVSIQFYAKTKIISFVSKKSFWPQPKVDSAIIKLEIESRGLKVDNDLFFQIVRAGFRQPRKQILNNLSKELKLKKEEVRLWLCANKINPEARAETLNIDDWIILTKNLKIART